MSRLSVPWIAVGVGLAAGLLIGLVYTWVIDPLQAVNTDPSYLSAPYREDWLRMLTLSFVADGDLQRAKSRLGGLPEDEVTDGLAELIEEYYAAGYPANTMRKLTALAVELDVYTPAMIVYLQTSTPTSRSTPTPTGGDAIPATDTPTTYTPTPTATKIPSTPTPTPPPSDYRLVSRDEFCSPLETARVEVVIINESGEGIPGVVIWLVWSDGAQRAVTGLKPDQGSGYADFGVELDQTYSLGVGELGVALVDGLSIEDCSADPGDDTVSSWRLVLEPREPPD